MVSCDVKSATEESIVFQICKSGNINFIQIEFSHSWECSCENDAAALDRNNMTAAMTLKNS